MKVTISDFIIAFFDLLEAEGRELKNNTKKVVFNSFLVGMGIVVVCFMFLIAIFSFAFGFYLWLRTIFNACTSAFLLSFLFFILGIVLLLFVKQKNDKY